MSVNILCNIAFNLDAYLCHVICNTGHHVVEAISYQALPLLHQAYWDLLQYSMATLQDLYHCQGWDLVVQ